MNATIVNSNPAHTVDDNRLTAGPKSPNIKSDDQKRANGDHVEINPVVDNAVAGNSSGEEEEEEEEDVMSTEEKQGLLTLAAEHDRVDIIKSILTEQEEERERLLHSGIPPLHTAVSFGSTNATQCLLRMGADPSIRPNVAELKAQHGVAKNANVNRYNGVSAWELAFGRDEASSSSAISRFAGSPSAAKPVHMAPSKREGIRYAFTAEALRCIGSDEASRLEELLRSGMPADTDIGGKNLYDWAVEMSAGQCQALLRPTAHDAAASITTDDNHGEHHQEQPQQQLQKQRSAVLDRTTTPGEESISQLVNRLIELDSLSRALSTCLDNLAEEVSVCHGLLLMGGGASALAAHVRSLKEQQVRRTNELERCQQEWEECEDELAYWLREVGDNNRAEIQGRMDHITTTHDESMAFRKDLYATPPGPNGEESHKRQLVAQIAASEQKVRKLRASIADLSEESTRDLDEVQRRGLSGGIKLVRGLREKLREIDFHQLEAKNGIATCRAKISLIHSRLQSLKHTTEKCDSTSTKNNGSSSNSNHNGSNRSDDPGNETTSNEPTSNGSAVVEVTELVKEKTTTTKQSDRIKRNDGMSSDHNDEAVSGDDHSRSFVDRIATGQSDAIAVRSPDGRGFFPVDLWDLFLKIIGLGRTAAQNSAESFRQSTSHVMIV